MNCKLQVLQENGLMRYKETCLKFDIIKQRTSKEKPMEIKLPVTFIYYNKSREFDNEFRKNMKGLGYICAITNRTENKEIFIKKEDIDRFVIELPDLETYYISLMPSFLEEYLAFYRHDTIKFNIRRESVHTGDCFAFKHSYQHKITRLDIKKQREEKEEKKENENIEFMKRVLNG